MQFGLMYMPNLRSCLISEKIIEEELVLAGSWVNPTMDMQGRYVFVDWGPDFVDAQLSLGIPLCRDGFTSGFCGEGLMLTVQPRRFLSGKRKAPRIRAATT